MSVRDLEVIVMSLMNLSKKLSVALGYPLGASAIFFVCLFIVFGLIFSVSQGDPVPDDAYFHFRFASLLHTEGLDVVRHFDRIYLTNGAMHGSRYTVTLYQISLIPFTFFSDQTFGLHMAVAFYMSIIGAIVYYILRKERVHHPLFFTLLLFTSTYFAARYLLGRSLVLMTVLVFVEMFCAIRRKYTALFFVTLFHVLWHQSTYFLPPLIVGMVEVARYLSQQRFLVKTIGASVLGSVVGMIFYPGFPESLFSWMKGLLVIQNSDAQAMSGSLGGAELATKDFMTYFIGQDTTFMLFVIGITGAMFFYVSQKRSEGFLSKLPAHRLQWIYTLFLFLLFATLGSCVVSGRFFDFILLAVVVFAAFVVTAMEEAGLLRVDAVSKMWIGAVFWVWLIALNVNTLMYVYVRSNSYDYAPAFKAAQWISAHSSGNSKVYLQNWGNFSLMFFGNAKDVYSTGIEPTALKDYDNALYWKYYNILAHNYYCELEKDCKIEFDTAAAQAEKMGPVAKEMFTKNNGKKVITSIKNDFGAQFIVSDNEQFDIVLKSNPDLIDQWFETQSDKYDGAHMHFTVYKLK